MSITQHKVTKAIFFIVLLFLGCSSGPRSYYSRTKGDYVNVEAPSSSSSTEAQQASNAKSGINNDLVKNAEAYLGVPYKWAGTSKKGMDCSGFILTVFNETYNLKLPHSSKALKKMGSSVDKDELKLGDIVLFGNFLGIHHAGIYVSDGRFIHSATSKGVMYSMLSESYYAKRYKGARRVLD